MGDKKLKLLYLAKYLEEETDQEHPAGMPELLAYLTANGISAERKSVYDDLRLLESFGMDIETVKGRQFGYYLGERTFQLPEVKLLVDAVQAAPFLTQKKSMELIGKLEQLTSRPMARQLRRQVYVLGRPRTTNETLYYAVDGIHTAISRDRQVSFRYFDWTAEGQRAFRRDGAAYVTDPVALCVDRYYYLVAYDSEAGIIKHFRVDKMLDIGILDEARDGQEGFAALDMAEYAKKVFGMFSGREERVRMRFDSRLVGAVLDRLGRDVSLIPDGETHFFVSADVVVSPQFFAWISGFGSLARIVGPDHVVQAMRAHAAEVLAMYE